MNACLFVGNVGVLYCEWELCRVCVTRVLGTDRVRGLGASHWLRAVVSLVES